MIYLKNKHLTYHLVQKKQYLSQQKLNQLLSMEKIEHYFYILHCEKLENEHWHIVFTSNDDLNIDELAKMFFVQKSDITKSYKRDDIILYIRKVLIDNEYKNIYTNFDWKTRLELFNMNIRNIESDIQLYRTAALKGISLKQIKNRNPKAYKKDKTLIDKFHYRYINSLDFHYRKINFYIFGKDIIVNNKLSHDIVKTLFSNIENDDILFETTTDNLNTWVKSYEEQPIIIWNNFTANDFLKAFDNNRKTVRHILDPYCHKLKIPLSYQESCKKSIILYNKIHIINSTCDYNSFIKELSGIEENEYIEQIDKRFSFILKFNNNNVTLFVNKDNECIVINTVLDKILLEIKKYYDLFTQ